MRIVDVEDSIITTVKDRFAGRLRMVDSLPTEWDDATFDRLLRQAPGVYVVFNGGNAIEDSLDIRAQWVLVAVTAHATERGRRHGDQREIGAYEIVETLAPLFHNRLLSGAGTFRFEGIDNLLDDPNEKKGAAIYAVRLSLAMSIEDPPPGSGDPLDAFITFTATHDLAPTDGIADAQDQVTLPQS